MPEGLRYDQHRPATEQEDEPLEGVIVDVGESPERAPRTLQQSIEFWQRKAAEQIREAHERIARESVQKSIHATESAHASGENTSTALVVPDKKRSPRSPSLVTTLERGIANVWQQYIEQVRDPIAVREFAAFLDAQIEHYHTEVLHQSDSDYAKRSAALRRKGYELDNNDSWSSKYTFKKRLPFGATKGERQSLDALLHSSEYAREAMVALKSVGIKLSDQLFTKRENVERVAALFTAVRGLEDTLHALGREARWTQVYTTEFSIAEFTDSITANRMAVEQLASPDVRKKFFAFLEHERRAPSLSDLALYTSILARPAVLDSITALPQVSYSSDWTTRYTLERLGFVDDAGGSALMRDLGTLGVQLTGSALYRYESIHSTYTTAEERPRNAEAFVASLAKDTEGLFTEEGRAFIADLRAWGFPVDVDSLGSVSALLPRRRETMAFFAAANAMHPAFLPGLVLAEIRSVVESPEKLQPILDPGYAAFVQRLFAVGFLKTDSTHWLRSDCLGFTSGVDSMVTIYQNAEARTALEQPHAVELYRVLQEGGEPIGSYNIVPALLTLATVAREGSAEVVTAMRAHGVSITSLNDLSYLRTAIHALCEPAERAALQDPRVPMVFSRLRALSQALRAYVSDGTLLVDAVQLITSGADVSTFESEPIGPEVSDFYQRLSAEHHYIRLSSVRDLAVLDNASLALLPRYTEMIASENYSEVELADAILFCREHAAVLRGIERGRSMYGESWKPNKAKVAYDLGVVEDWSVNTQVIEMLSKNGRPSPELLAAATRDVQAFLRLDYIARQIGSRVSLSEWAPHSIINFLAFAPYVQVMQETLEDFPLNRYTFSMYSRESLMRHFQELAIIDRAVRREAARHVSPQIYDWNNALPIQYAIATYSTEHPQIIAAMDVAYGTSWTITSAEHLKQLTEENYRAILSQSQAFSAYGLPVDPAHLIEARLFVEAGLQPFVEQLRQEQDENGEKYTLTYEAIPGLAQLASAATVEGPIAVLRSLRDDFGLPLMYILNRPMHAVEVCNAPAVRTAWDAVRAAGMNPQELGDLFDRLDRWELAAQYPKEFALMLKLRDTVAVSLGNFDALSVVVDRPEVVRYIEEHIGLEDNLDIGYITTQRLHVWISLYEHRAFVEELRELGVTLTNMLTEGYAFSAIAEWQHPNKLEVWRTVVALGETVPFESMDNYRAFVDANQLEQYLRLRQVFGIPFREVLVNPSILNILGIIEGQTVDREALPQAEMVERQLNVAQVMHEMLKHQQWSAVDATGCTVEGPLGETMPASEYFRSFAERYAGKGKSILALVAAREYRGQSFPELLAAVATQLQKYESILQLGERDRVPAGFRTSLGMEYEITDSIAKGYSAQHGGRELKKDIMRMSTYAAIPRGNDAYHEIAAAPTDNPYALLLEMHLLQDLGYIDFNFASEDYNRGGHGFHLTLSGEKGISATPQTHALQNTLAMTGWSGVNTGQELTGSVVAARGTSLRERGSFGPVHLFANAANATELRALSIDQWEPFERTITTAHLGAVAIQVTEHALTLATDTQRWEELMTTLAADFPTSPEALYQSLRQQDLVKNELKTPAQRRILYAWLRLQTELVRAMEDHSTHFLDNELYGYEDERGSWVEPQDFGGTSNQTRFESVVKSGKEPVPLNDYADSTRIAPRQLFTEVTPEFVNALTRTANLFLKPAVEGRGDRTNALAVLETTKLGNGQLEDQGGHPSRRSVFDRGTPRKGYYAYQGASERMIIHASQRAVLRFQEAMRATLVPDVAETTQQSEAA